MLNDVGVGGGVVGGGVVWMCWRGG
jgi:hypothetical protein